MRILDVKAGFFMKKSIYFLGFILCGPLSLYGMEADRSPASFLFDGLAAELQEKILEYAQEPMPIKDGIQDVAQWKQPVADGASYDVEWSPNSDYVVSSGAGNVQVHRSDGALCSSMGGEGSFLKCKLPFSFRKNSWSLDSSIAFVEQRLLAGSSLGVYTPYGEKRYELDGDRAIIWMPDGRLLSYDAFKCIRLHTPDGELDSEFTWCGGSAPIISPNGLFLCECFEGGRIARVYTTKGEECAEWPVHDRVVGVNWTSDSRFISTLSPENTVQVHTPQGEKCAEWSVNEGSRFSWSPDSEKVIRCNGVDKKKVQLCSSDGVKCAEWEHGSDVMGAHWLPGGKFIASVHLGVVQIHRENGERVTEWSLPQKMDRTKWSPNGSLKAWSRKNRINLWTNCGEQLAEYEQDGSVKKFAWAPNGERIATGERDGTIRIKDIKRVLLAHHQLQRPTINQHKLLRKLQERILRENKPAILGQTERTILDTIPEVKKLLRIETNTAEKRLWRVMLKDSKPDPADIDKLCLRIARRDAERRRCDVTSNNSESEQDMAGDEPARERPGNCAVM